MNQLDEFALVIELACETEDRTADEQRALLATALRVDVKRSHLGTLNQRGEPLRPYLFEQVVESYAADGGRPVRPTKAQLEKLNRRHAMFDDYVNARGDWVRVPAVADVKTQVV